jgi:hypothetical protein
MWSGGVGDCGRCSWGYRFSPLRAVSVGHLGPLEGTGPTARTDRSSSAPTEEAPERGHLAAEPPLVDQARPTAHPVADPSAATPAE